MKVDLLLLHLNHLRVDEVVEAVTRGLAVLSRYADEVEEPFFGMQPITVHATGPGRPRFEIPSSQLENLLDLNCDCPTIASILGVSLRTIRRRMEDFNLSVQAHYSNIDDDSLDCIVREVKHHFVNCGYRLMDGLLRQCGIRQKMSERTYALN